MAVQVNPIAPSLPATTAIQDPATRRFAQAVEDALRALRSEEGAVESLKKAADAMNGAISGGTPPSIAQWLFSSELHQKLTTEIARVDIQAKQDVIDEALARQTAIDEINATLATIQSTAAYDPLVTYAVGDMVTYDGKLYQAILETTGNLPTNTTYWKKVGDYATLGDVVAAHTLEIDDLDSRVTTNAGNLTAEIASRQALATQVRGSYTGTDVNQVSQGLIYSERVARATADSNEVAARQSLSAKLLGATSPDGLTLETLSEGLVFDERQARVSGDGANASSISALRAQVGVTEAGALTTGLILDEKNVRASNDLAIVSAVNTALAQITGISTSISQSGQNLIANWTQAQATKWSQIEAEVLTAGGQTIRAALQQESNARSTLAGQVSASWMVKAEVDVGTGKPYVAGIALGAEGQGGAATSEFIIRADKFAVVMPGYGEHVPFAIGPSGAEFTGLTSWGNVTGSGKPADGATSGANLVKKSHFRDGLAGGWGGTVSINSATNSGRGEIASSGRDAYEYGNEFAVVGNEKLFVAYDAYTALTAHETRFGLQFLDAVGGIITWVGVPTAAGQTWHHVKGEITVPTGAVTARPWLQISASDNFGVGVWNALYVGRVEESATVGASFGDYWGGGRNITGAITPGNVTTYIDNAAIGNAQIGGNLWSTNWNYAGGTGWLLDRSGNFYGNNIYARGDIEASSLRAGVAMVDALNIKGSAMIIPIFISHGAGAWNMPYSRGTWQHMEVWKYTFTTATTGTFRISFGGLWSITHWTGHANWPTGTVDKMIRILIDGNEVETVAQDATYGGVISNFNIGDRFYTIGAGTHSISVYMSALMADGGATFSRTSGSTTIQSHSQGLSSI